MNLKASLGRVLVLFGLIAGVGAAVFMLKGKLSSIQLTQLGPISEKIKGVSTSLHVQGLAEGIEKKLVDRQSIITEETDPPANTEGMVLNFSDQTKQMVQGVAQKAVDELKSVPQEQATKIAAQICAQIMANLEQSPTPEVSQTPQSE